MNMHFLKLYGVVVLAALVASCDTNSASLTALDKNYYPLRVGSQWIYSIEETSISQTSCDDSGAVLAKYELSVTVTDSVPTSDGSYRYILQRAKRIDSNEPWLNFETWAVEKSSTQIIGNESDVKYVKLVFPIFNGLTWNGNLLNNSVQLNKLTEDSYKVASFEKPYTSATGQQYAKTITIIQEEEQSNLLYRDSRSEIYAYGVGLVYKESYLLNYFANSQLPCFGKNKVQQGYVLKQSLKEYNR
jgi:hypothetical protein